MIIYYLLFTKLPRKLRTLLCSRRCSGQRVGGPKHRQRTPSTDAAGVAAVMLHEHPRISARSHAEPRTPAETAGQQRREASRSAARVQVTKGPPSQPLLIAHAHTNTHATRQPTLALRCLREERRGLAQLRATTHTMGRTQTAVRGRRAALTWLRAVNHDAPADDRAAYAAACAAFHSRMMAFTA